MAESNCFERSNSSGNTLSNFHSFFDWNSEMRLAKGSGGDSNDSSITNIGTTGSKDNFGGNKNVNWDAQYLDFGPCPGLTLDSQNQNGSDVQSEQQRQQEQMQEQMMQALQNFVRAFVALAMLWQRMSQGANTGYGGSDGGRDFGNGSGSQNSGGYDCGAGSDTGHTRPSKPVLPARPSTPDKPATPDRPEAPSTPDSPTMPSNPGAKYADTGIERGRTIYRDDFNGARGEKPNQGVFDTAHIGADGKTRQRGPSIDEDGIISTNNTVQDGHGDLQLFPVKQKTYDPVAKEYVDYTKGSFNTTEGLHFNLKDHPNGVAIEVRAKHPTRPGAKFDALWIMTDHWTADPAKGEKQGDTIEYDAGEGGGADISIHYPTKTADGGSQDHYGGGAHPKDVKFDDGKFHTYTVVVTPNAKTGKGDVVEYVDGKKEFAKENVFPGDKDLHLRSSLEVSPKWTHKTLTGPGGMDSDAAGVIDYLDVSELKKR